MFALLRSTILIMTAIPMFALDTTDVSGTWQADGAATWAELARTPQFEHMPQDQIDLIKPQFIASISSMTITLSSTTSMVTSSEVSSNAASAAGIANVTKLTGNLKNWTSTGATTANVVLVDGTGKGSTRQLEAHNAKTLRMMGDGKNQAFTVVFHPAATATPSAPTN